ncbi:MAG: conserved membrane protein of unknown function [Nitrospira sp.]|nr:MAG: conserved membrane protein of unknown function [Nitrospira sp.]
MPHIFKTVWLALATLGQLISPITLSTTWADDKIMVRAGESAVVVRTPQAITDEKANLGSVTKIVQGTVPTTTNVVIYVPPPGVNEVEDTVKYIVGGQTVTVQIAVKPAAPVLTDPQLYEASFKALFALLILAVLVENGLALLFRWRPFLDYFDTRTVNALVAFTFSLLFVWLFEVDIVASLINTYSGSKHPLHWSSMLLTAAIIAGGSAGVNRVFQSLGFRVVSSQQPPTPKPPPTEAWIAVTLVRERAVGSVTVLLGQPGHATVAGAISGVTPGRSWWRYFVRDKGRFPQTGGFSVTPGGTYEVLLHGTDRAGNPLVSKTWGPYELAPGALVDIELSA